jgi:hypothetical protein
VSGVGQQPVGFDEWSAFYEAYRVVGSQITLQLQRTTSECILTVTPSNDNGAPSTTDLAMQAPYTTYDVISSSIFKSQQINQMNSATIFGVDSILYDDDFQALVTASPNRQWYWTINCTIYDGTTTSLVTYINVLVSYDTIMFRRRPLGQS